MSRISKGIQEVTIGGHDYTLKATIQAIEEIENRFGGNMLSAAQACMKLGFQDAAFIISKAAGLNKEETRQLKQNIVSSGIEVAAEIAAKYLSMLLNPEGKDFTDEDPGEA